MDDMIATQSNSLATSDPFGLMDDEDFENPSRDWPKFVNQCHRIDDFYFSSEYSGEENR